MRTCADAFDDPYSPAPVFGCQATPTRFLTSTTRCAPCTEICDRWAFRADSQPQAELWSSSHVVSPRIVTRFRQHATPDGPS